MEGTPPIPLCRNPAGVARTHSVVFYVALKSPEITGSAAGGCGNALLLRLPAAASRLEEGGEETRDRLEPALAYYVPGEIVFRRGNGAPSPPLMGDRAV